jgi:hypothetical protein
VIYSAIACSFVLITKTIISITHLKFLYPQNVLRHYAPILTHRRFHLRRFMSEVLGYVLRKAPLHLMNDCISSIVDILAPQVVMPGCSVTDKVGYYSGVSLQHSV